MSCSITRSMPNSSDVIAYSLIGGSVGGLAAFISPKMPVVAGVLFGGTFALVSVSTYSSLNCLGRSNPADITRIALAAFAGAAAGMAAAALGGYAITVLNVGELFFGVIILTFTLFQFA